MKHTRCALLLLVAALSGCSSHDQEKAKTEIKTDAKDLANKVDAAVKPSSEKASEKLDHAALLAKVKTALASNAGLATLTTVDVDVTGSDVTLSGSVATSEQKKMAEQTATQVEGVTRVHNALVVKP